MHLVLGSSSSLSCPLTANIEASNCSSATTSSTNATTTPIMMMTIDHDAADDDANVTATSSRGSIRNAETPRRNTSTIGSTDSTNAPIPQLSAERRGGAQQQEQEEQEQQVTIDSSAITYAASDTSISISSTMNLTKNHHKSGSLSNLSETKQIEYWKNRAIRAIHSSKELIQKNAKLEEEVIDLTRRADRFEKRAKRYARELKAVRDILMKEDSSGKFCRKCANCTDMEDVETSKDRKIIEPTTASYEVALVETKLEELLGQSVRDKWDDVRLERVPTNT